MLEFSIFGILATCIAGMITAVSRKRDDLPVWERENGKREFEKWLTGFLAKLKRNSTRTEKCRLISSVERMTFEENTKNDGYEVNNFWFFLFCDWKLFWTLLYAPIDEKERKKIDEIVKVNEFFKAI